MYPGAPTFPGIGTFPGAAPPIILQPRELALRIPGGRASVTVRQSDPITVRVP